MSIGDDPGAVESTVDSAVLGNGGVDCPGAVGSVAASCGAVCIRNLDCPATDGFTFEGLVAVDLVQVTFN